MPIKTIFCVTSVNDDDGALAEAIQYCENTRAHLSVLVVGVSPPPPVYAYGTVPDDSWTSEISAGKAKATERGEAVEKQVQKAGISADVSISYSEYAQIDDVVGERARYADITLIPSTMSNDGDLRDKAVYGALYLSTKPVYLSAPSSRKTFEADKIMIAWDSGVPAARAVGQAMGLLRNSREVYIVMVDPVASSAINGGEPGADLAQYLARHGMKIEVERLASGGLPVSEVLQKHARDIGADLMVMGAFGHSRLRQLIFGGTTASMLETPTVPVLLSH